jgi:hypothetical protein
MDGWMDGWSPFPMKVSLISKFLSKLFFLLKKIKFELTFRDENHLKFNNLLLSWYNNF